MRRIDATRFPPYAERVELQSPERNHWQSLAPSGQALPTHRLGP